jgi:hypothetical protein
MELDYCSRGVFEAKTRAAAAGISQSIISKKTYAKTKSWWRSDTDAPTARPAVNRGSGAEKNGRSNYRDASSPE